ncbi:undecaprenyl-diphosphate phosphatase [Fulvivirga sp. RKSG066]|uniref:undecaprenyl-diphosphate phosphatase n=1 Tax=Fulvivirga aurantia TaxID=2529383 RepID=UPI0012BCD5EB|nr:undecaprenyl-diphosphate phosphatase [Fulvivirga aurantia]MTI22070.1 undecaprenyl-diphosphate phosphatase [Fulvivirga aurantia]
MTLIEAIILGIIQGLTEFLPVSSSGHLELGAIVLGLETSNNLLFSIIVHAATALSTIVVFRKEILTLIKDLFAFKWNESTEYIAKIAVSMIPVFIVGVFFEDKVEALFSGQILLVSSMLFVTGLLLLISHYTKPKDGSVTFGKSIIIGLAQAIAIMPGISRSGSTITTALFLGVDRSKAARFSFLMVLPPILGAALLKTLELMDSGTTLGSNISTLALIAGFIAAFVAGLLACTWMIRLVRKGKLVYFAIYCFVIAFVGIVATFI